MTLPWRAGDPLIVRFGRFGMARWVLSGNVVEDTEDIVTVWIPPKAPFLELALPDGRLLRDIPRMQALEIDTQHVAVMQAGTWFGNGVVMQFPLIEPWSVWWFFHDDGSFDGWYGNLEAPKIRWEGPDECRGLDTSDGSSTLSSSPTERGGGRTRSRSRPRPGALAFGPLTRWPRSVRTARH